MDLQKPEMDGLEATRQIRADPALDGIRIVAMTANAMLEDQGACIEAGMNGFVPKPIRAEELYDALLPVSENYGR